MDIPHSPFMVGMHLGCFYFLAFMDYAVMNIGVQILYLHGHMFLFLLDIYLAVKFLGHVVTLFFKNNLRNCQTVFQRD